MGIFRTKEDDVAKISTSIYVSNFPEVFSAKDLFHACKKYGHVIDSFIPFKKSKDGKRFGFVRFINVFNMERLVIPEFADEFDDDDESEEGSKGDTANSHGAFNFDDADDVDKVPETELDDPLDKTRSMENIYEHGKDNNYYGSIVRVGLQCGSGLFKKPVAPQSRGSILCVLEELEGLDKAMDIYERWDGLEEIPLGGRMEVIKSIQYLDKIINGFGLNGLKVKWAIEGDENSRYFHGVLNKKRSQSNIRGIMVDAKILANRLVGVLGDIVNEVQSAFISDRQILDGPFILMRLSMFPLTVLRSLESIRCQFFNGHELKSNKSSWVKWNSVLAAKEKGGLGVSSLFALNRALLMKMVLRFYSLNDSLCLRASLDNNFRAALEEESSSLSSRKLRTCSFRSASIRVLIDGSGLRGSGGVFWRFYSGLF
ncbi:nucleotide-binding alpha-beta plait domain-containing protein [Tanacetum coccineum]